MIYQVTKIKNPKIEKIYEVGMKQLSEFFGINWIHNLPEIWIVENGETNKSLQGKNYQNWVKGWGSRHKGIYLLRQEIIKKETGADYDDKKYKSLIIHELAHCFFDVATNGKRNPKWLPEGLSLYLAEQLKEKWHPKPKKFTDFLNYFNQSKEVYKESGWAIKFLIDKFGKEKLLRLLKEIKETDGKNYNEDIFKSLFEKVYKENLSYDLFNE